MSDGFAQKRYVARNTRPAGVEDAAVWAAAWVGYHSAYSGSFRPGAARGRGFALSSVAPHGTGRVDRRGMGGEREPPACPLLQAHHCRPKATCRRREELEAADRGGGARTHV